MAARYSSAPQSLSELQAKVWAAGTAQTHLALTVFCWCGSQSRAAFQGSNTLRQCTWLKIPMLPVSTVPLPLWPVIILDERKAARCCRETKQDNLVLLARKVCSPPRCSSSPQPWWPFCLVPILCWCWDLGRQGALAIENPLTSSICQPSAFLGALVPSSGLLYATVF